MTSKTMKIGRPRQIYNGHLDREFVPIEKRKNNEFQINMPKRSEFYNIPFL